MNYNDYLAAKMAQPPAAGIDEYAPGHGLFPHQAAIVEWALRRGRAAIFADTGLGKTLMQLDWARVVAATVGRVLVLAPLAVAEQTIREGARFGIAAEYDRTGQSAAAIVVTNYEMMDRFEPAEFAGVVLDESSILKSYTGAFRNAIIEAFAQTPFRLACTATPAPNDFTELGNHAEFLGVKLRTEMLSEYFVHDGGSTQDWRLKGHAVDAFWRWVASWAAVIKRPSDLGFDDEGFDLPPLRMHEHIVPVDHADAQQEGLLFAPQARSLADQRATRRMTMRQRVAIAAEIAEADEPVLVWAELNAEADAATAAIPDAVQVRGSDSHDDKARRLLGFADGTHRVLVTKPSIAGFGLNWQHCARVVFLGASHSYEQTYQAIRRCWRFGQERPVDVHIIRAETEAAVIANYRRKEADAERMTAVMLAHVRDEQCDRHAAGREWDAYFPRVPMTVPAWVGVEGA